MLRPGRALVDAWVSIAMFVCACDSNTVPTPRSTGGAGATGGGNAGGAAVAGSSGVGGASAAAGSSGLGGTASGASGSSSGTAGSTSGGAGSSGTGGTGAAGSGSGGAGTGGTSVAGSAGTSGGNAGAGGEAGDAGGEAGEGGAPMTPEMVTLFDGESLAEWRPVDGNGDAAWDLPGDGTMVVAPGSGNIVSRRTFGDVFVHVEYKTPALAANVTGQDRGNSGVYLNSMYELQVLDSFGLAPAINGCGSIYGVSVPSSTACYEQEVWNTYEIDFQAARFDDQNRKVEDARVLSATLNGVLVQDDVAVPGSTEAGEPEAPGPGPLMLQDHGNRVAFRNIWVIPR